MIHTSYNILPLSSINHQFVSLNLFIICKLQTWEPASAACDDEQSDLFYSLQAHMETWTHGGESIHDLERKKEAEWTRMGEIEFLAVAEARKAIFWPTPGFKDWTFDSSGFSTEGTLILAYVVHYR